MVMLIFYGNFDSPNLSITVGLKIL